MLPLEIETGRFAGKPVAERLCKVCNTLRVEDEFHFLFSCCMYQRERSFYYVENIDNIEHFMLLSDDDKVKYMLQKEHIKSTGVYVNTIYQNDVRSCITLISNNQQIIIIVILILHLSN